MCVYARICVSRYMCMCGSVYAYACVCVFKYSVKEWVYVNIVHFISSFVNFIIRIINHINLHHEYVQLGWRQGIYCSDLHPKKSYPWIYEIPGWWWRHQVILKRSQLLEEIVVMFTQVAITPLKILCLHQDYFCTTFRTNTITVFFLKEASRSTLQMRLYLFILSR